VYQSEGGRCVYQSEGGRCVYQSEGGFSCRTLLRKRVVGHMIFAEPTLTLVDV
jgi:hypothetical protein